MRKERKIRSFLSDHESWFHSPFSVCYITLYTIFFTWLFHIIPFWYFVHFTRLFHLGTLFMSISNEVSFHFASLSEYWSLEWNISTEVCASREKIEKSSRGQRCIVIWYLINLLKTRPFIRNSNPSIAFLHLMTWPHRSWHFNEQVWLKVNIWIDFPRLFLFRGEKRKNENNHINKFIQFACSPDLSLLYSHVTVKVKKSKSRIIEIARRYI